MACPVLREMQDRAVSSVYCIYFHQSKEAFYEKTVYPKNVSQKSNDLLNSIKKFLLLNFYNNDNNKKILNVFFIFPIVVLTQDFL